MNCVSIYVYLSVGDSDELVPHHHMRLLYELATGSSFRDLFIVKNGTHNDTWERAGSAYYEVYTCIYI
jgi:fermentation-respiration switch protein FrsA (DUF1100 family)